MTRLHVQFAGLDRPGTHGPFRYPRKRAYQSRQKIRRQLKRLVPPDVFAHIQVKASHDREHKGRLVFIRTSAEVYPKLIAALSKPVQKDDQLTWRQILREEAEALRDNAFVSWLGHRGLGYFQAIEDQKTFKLFKPSKKDKRQVKTVIISPDDTELLEYSRERTQVQPGKLTPWLSRLIQGLAVRDLTNVTRKAIRTSPGTQEIQIQGEGPGKSKATLIISPRNSGTGLPLSMSPYLPQTYAGDCRLRELHLPQDTGALELRLERGQKSLQCLLPSQVSKGRRAEEEAIFTYFSPTRGLLGQDIWPGELAPEAMTWLRSIRQRLQDLLIP